MGITLGENDRILVATAEGEKQVKAEDNVSSGDVIRVVRIRTEEVTENEAVAYSTVYEEMCIRDRDKASRSALKSCP